jgi:hypothetical protein
MGGNADKHLPPNACAHYFTRNRTHGSDFPLLFPSAYEVPTIVPRCFRLLFGSRKGLLFVIGRVRFLVKPTFFGASGLLE